MFSVCRVGIKLFKVLSNLGSSKELRWENNWNFDKVKGCSECMMLIFIDVGKLQMIPREE